MRCCNGVRADEGDGPRSVWRWCIRTALLLVWGFGLSGHLVAHAQPIEPVATVRHEPGGIYLTARLPLELTAGMEEVLLRGVPVHFVWRAELRRDRWYWTDQRLVVAQRTVRVAYQPLTRRWRLSVSTDGDGTGLQGALHQNLDSFQEAMSAVVSVARWPVAGPEHIPSRSDLRIDVQFRLDAGLLPRPFQSDTMGAAGWGGVYRFDVEVPPVEPLSEPQ